MLNVGLWVCMYSRTADTWRLNPWFFAAQIQIQIANKYLGCGYKGLVFCRNNGWIMENMDKGLTVPKWVLIVWPKIPQMPQWLASQFVSPSFKNLDFNRLYWAFVVGDISVLRNWLSSDGDQFKTGKLKPILVSDILVLVSFQIF